MPHQDDGLLLFLSATVSLFGSWVGYHQFEDSTRGRAEMNNLVRNVNDIIIAVAVNG